MAAEKNSFSILVIGSDGLIGGALTKHLERAGLPVMGTTRRREAVTKTRPFLDLSEDLERWQPPEGIRVAVMCAGVTKMESCRLDPVYSAQVNVAAVSRLVRKLADDNVYVIYLSTNQVFDGARPNQPANAPTSARTEYGKQKAAAEKYLLSLGSGGSVVRLTKVIQPHMFLLQGWLEALREGKAIRPFADMVMAPISLSFTVSVLCKLIEVRPPGIIQVSGERDVTYAQVADHLARRTGASAALVQPIRVRDAGLPPESAPPHTTLDTTRLRMELGLEPPGVWTVIESALGLQPEELRS
ncbi:MAG TPA: sugar nucleotide-binding protein [Pyrinomonadaceae bacterium]